MNEENSVETVETKKKPGPKPKNSKNSKSPIISVDTSISDMLEYDRNGELLSFETSEEGFKNLSSDVVKELSFDNKMRYRFAKDFYQQETKTDNADWKDRIQVTEQYASPIERTSVKNPEPGKRYYLSTPEKISKHESEGYRVVSDNSKTSIGLSGRKTIGTLGKEELILMETSVENAEKLGKAKKEIRERRKGNIEGSVHDLGSSLDIEVRDIN